MAEIDGGEEFISNEMVDALKWSKSGQWWWSFANNGTTTCVIIFSALAAVFAQVSGPLLLIIFHKTIVHMDPKTAATILSLLVTILSTVQSKLGFERKWIANRMTNSALRQLEIDQKTGATSLTEMTSRLKTILETHDKAIVNQANG
jgi:hypothetical protein